MTWASPTDAIDVVQNLYTNATTAIKTPHGSTSSIPMERGTIQGDSLSPFLFIVYLEPLLRWLRVGVNGYIPGVYKQSMAVDRLKAHIPDSTYADDLNLVTHTAPRFQKQLDKVTNYSIWGNLIVNISKTLVTGARYHTNPQDPYDSSSLKRILSSVTVQGQHVTFHDPRKPFRYLGVHLTMHMDWSHQLQVTIEALKSMLKGIKASNAKVYQKMCTIKSFDTGGSDHRMLVLTMRLRLSVAKQHSAKGQPARPYDCSRLQESAATQQCFELAMSNQFSRLVGAQLQSAQDEWTQLTAAASQAAHKAGLNLKPQQRRRDFAISDATLQKIERKHAAHAAVLSSPNDATRADYREANNAARRAVKKDQERYFKQQALFAEHALKAGNLAVFHKHVQRIFKEQQGSSSAAPTAVLGGADGKQLFQSREEVVKCFAEHFADVLNCPAKLDQQMQQTIEELVQKMEAGQGANQQSEAAAQPPTVQEVEEAVFACRNGAAPGVDGIAAPMLKLSGTMLKWLHRVIVAVWESGKAPVEWKRALLVALYKGKGERKVRDSYRGISLLSTPGKVYVLVILAKISSHIDAQLLDNQSAFRKGRGLTDALFTIRQVISKYVAFDQPLFMAFVDLRKAYDSVPRDTLWRILHVYGVHTKLIELLMDLHTGTQAAVRMGGVVSEWFDVHGGVRQGCVIAPLLFNIYMDFVVRQAMAQMPEGCGVKLAYHADGKLERDGCGSGGGVELLSVLLYADDMVLLSPSREELVVMLQVMDKVAASLGLRINASKTEILSIDKDWKEGDVPVQQGPEVVISEGVVKEVSQFKYLGSVLVTDGRLDVELNIRRGKAVGRFKQFEKMWGTKHLSLATKVKCYKAYVLPILLFGSECWSLTKVQSQKLERVHSSCLRSILGVRLSDRHTNEHIRKSCGVATLSAYITANRLRWLGHVGRMEEGRLPHIALFSSLHGDMTRPVGRPRHTWEKCVCADLKVLGQDEGSWEASCQIKSAWRKRLWDLTHPWESQRLVRCRRRTKQAIDKHVERYVVPFSGWEDGGSPVPRWWEPPPAPTRVVLDPAASPPPMCDGSGAGFGF